MDNVYDVKVLGIDKVEIQLGEKLTIVCPWSPDDLLNMGDICESAARDMQVLIRKAKEKA